MSVLAIDTSSRARVVCVLATRDGEVLDAEVIRDQPAATSLPRALARMLARVDEAVVVVTGPGTYTGVRAGMAAALGIAHARGLPLHGIGSLEVVACAAPAEGSDGWVVADASRGALYVARVTNAATPSRVSLDRFDAAGLPVLSSDPVAVEGAVIVDPARALARAVALAITRTALDSTGLSAHYVE